MAHLNEPDQEVQFLHTKILEIMREKGVKTGDKEIISNCCKAVKKLGSFEKTQKISVLLKIIVAYRKSVQLNSDILEIVDVAMRKEPSLMLSILKCCLVNAEFKNVDDVCHILGRFPEEPKVAMFIKKHIEKRQCFDSRKIDGNQCIESKQTEKKDMHSEMKRKIETMLLEAAPDNAEILGYLRKNADFPAEILEKIPSAISTDQKNVLEILEIFYALTKNAQILNPRLVELTTHAILEEEHYDDEISRFVSSFSHLLVPAFISLIEAMNAAFLETNRYSYALRNVVGYIGVETFIDIVAPLDIPRHSTILKHVSNADLSIFVRLYKRQLSENTGELVHLLECLPGFCSYCTDYDDVVGEVLDICKNSVEKNRSAIFRAVERLIYTQSQNLRERLCLPVEIPREHSLSILERIKTSNFVLFVVGEFLRDSEAQCDTLLDLLIDLTGLDLSVELENLIMGVEGKSEILTGRVEKGDALRLMAHFVKKWIYSYDFISEIVSLCSSPEVSIQKKAYSLLTSMYRQINIPCICDTLFTATERLLQAPAARHRILLLYTVARKGCVCSTDVKSLFFRALSRYSGEGNSKCRKTVREIVCEIAGNKELHEFILGSIDPDSEDPQMLLGYVNLIDIVVDCAEKYGAEDGMLEVLFERLLTVCFVAESLVRPLILVFGRFLRIREFSPHFDEILRILCEYLRKYNKKYNRELREVAMIAKNSGCELPGEMRMLLRLKNKGGNYRKIQIAKEDKE